MCVNFGCGRGKFRFLGMGGWRLQAWSVSLVLCAAVFLQGCATNPEKIPVDAASEAQRLVFGAPEAVRTQFASQIGDCWFVGDGPLKGQYSFTMPAAEDSSEPSLIRIFRIDPEREEAFQVQFYPHNDNTVVATRNLGLPEGLASELETSVELWLMEPAKCRPEQESVAANASWAPSVHASDAPDDQSRGSPGADDGQRGAREGEIDMHEAELRARGAIE